MRNIKQSLWQDLTSPISKIQRFWLRFPLVIIANLIAFVITFLIELSSLLYTLTKAVYMDLYADYRKR